MTVIVGFMDKQGRATLVADRVWYGYGHDRVVGRKIFALSDCVVGFAGDHRSLAMVKASNFDELVLALEAQGETDALIIHRNRIFTYLTGPDDKKGTVRIHGYETHRTIGSYHCEVNHAISIGREPIEAVQLVHSLWLLDMPVDIADESWTSTPDSMLAE